MEVNIVAQIWLISIIITIDEFLNQNEIRVLKANKYVFKTIVLKKSMTS